MTENKKDLKYIESIHIPENVILNKGTKKEKWKKNKVAVYSVIESYIGKNNKAFFSDSILNSQIGYKNKYAHSGVEKCINEFCNEGYYIVEHIDKKIYNLKKNICDLDFKNTGIKFATLYIDEIEKILNFVPQDITPPFDSAVTLQVFAYLKLKIFSRGDRISFETNPEVLNGYYRDFAKELGLCVKTFSTCIMYLESMELIHTYRPAPLKLKDDKYLTNTTLISLFERRRKGKILESGKAYYEKEIKEKLRMLKKIF